MEGGSLTHARRRRLEGKAAQGKEEGVMEGAKIGTGSYRTYIFRKIFLIFHSPLLDSGYVASYISDALHLTLKHATVGSYQPSYKTNKP